MKLKASSLFFFLLICYNSFSQVRLCSWNLQNFGKSKSDSALSFIAATLNEFDIVAVVEVVAGNGGAQAVARLADALDREGTDWDYCVSDPTFGAPNKSERYAFLWKTARVKRSGEAWLEKTYKEEIEREPYFATFAYNSKHFTVGTFHAVPKDKHPEKEIAYFKLLPGEYPDKTVLFCGDFNCPESNKVFDSLKIQEYKPAFVGQRTTLKTECVGEQCLASEYDNVFYPGGKIQLVRSGAVHFYKNFPNMKEARRISDHLPVFLEFNLN